MNKVIWTGSVDGSKTRIRQVDFDDCVVEIEKNDEWVASGDRHASHAYMKALIWQTNVLETTEY